MQLYSIHKKGKAPEVRCSLAVDPGYRTSGFSLLNFDDHKIRVWGGEDQGKKIMGLSYPKVLELAVKRTNYYMSQLPKGIPPKNMEVITEMTFMTGEFSLGLSVLNSLFISALYKKGVGRIVLIQPRIAQWFMNAKNLPDNQIKEFVRVYIQSRVGKDLVSDLTAHSADAILFHVFCHYSYFNKRYGVSIRKPQVEPVEVEWSV